MTILQFTLPFHPSYGGIYTTAQTFREIACSQIVEIVSSDLKGQTQGDYQINLFDRSIFSLYPLSINHRQVFSQISQLSPRLIIIHGFWRVHDTLGYRFAKQHGIPYLVVPHGALDPYVFTYRAWRKHLWMKGIGQKILQDASAVVCSTHREYQKAEKYLERANVEICHWGVKRPSLDDASHWRQEVREQLNINPEQRVLLFLGRIHKMKRPIETALAFKQLQPKNWIFLIVGDLDEGVKFADLQNICYDQTCRYLPFVSGLEKWKLLAAADAFVNFSHRENFGNSVVEAASMGLPLLISDGVDTYPLFQKANAASVAHIQSFQDILESLDDFLQRTTLEHIEMGKNGAKCFEENFAEEIFHKNLRRIVHQYAAS